MEWRNQKTGKKKIHGFYCGGMSRHVIRAVIPRGRTSSKEERVARGRGQ